MPRLGLDQDHVRRLPGPGEQQHHQRQRRQHHEQPHQVEQRHLRGGDPAVHGDRDNRGERTGGGPGQGL